MNRREYIRLQNLGLATLFVPQMETEWSWSHSVERLMGIDPPKLFGAEKIQLTRRAYKAFNRMKMAAWNDGIGIRTVSSFRSYADQKRIFERKFKAFTEEGDSGADAIERIIEYSTLPGTSRHHWGTDIDIVQAGRNVDGDSLLEEHFEPGGAFRALKEWLDQNATDFDFYLVYTQDAHRKGFNYEPWHLSYAPESISLLKSYLRKEVIHNILSQKVIGYEHLSEERLNRYLEEHLLGINPKLLP